MTGYFARGTGCCGHDERGLRLVLPDAEVLGAGGRDASAAAARAPAPTGARGSVAAEGVGEVPQSTPISRILFAFARQPALRPATAARRNDHSSSPAIAGGIKQPTRRLRTGRPQTPPYLVLLRAGFCLPPMLPPARCALTAPFHHYLPALTDRRQAVYFLCHFPSGYPARALPGALPCGVRTFLPPPLFASRGRPAPARAREAGDRLAWLRLRDCSHRSASCNGSIVRHDPSCMLRYPSVSCVIRYCSSFL